MQYRKQIKDIQLFIATRAQDTRYRYVTLLYFWYRRSFTIPSVSNIRMTAKTPEVCFIGAITDINAADKVSAAYSLFRLLCTANISEVQTGKLPPMKKLIFLYFIVCMLLQFLASSLSDIADASPQRSIFTVLGFLFSCYKLFRLLDVL